jgi:hypothetical protein
LLGPLLLGAAGGRQAGVVHQRPRRAQLALDAREGLHGGRAVGEVDLDGQHAHAVARAEVGGDGLEAVAATREDGHVRAGRGQRVGELDAEAGGRAGDDGHAAAEPEELFDGRRRKRHGRGP